MNTISKFFSKINFFIWRKVVEKHFFRNVTFENKNMEKSFKESILKWVFNLKKYKNISIDNFEFLFSQYSDLEIAFPVKLTGHKRRPTVIGSNGATVYLLYPNFDYSSLCFYTIYRRDNDFSREFKYEITSNSGIRLIKYYIGILNNGLNTDTSVEVIIDNPLTRKAYEMLMSSSIENLSKADIEFINKNGSRNQHIILKVDNFSLDITLLASAHILDKIANYLLSLIDKTDYFYNVLPIFEYITKELKVIYPVSISSTLDSHILSEISMSINLGLGEDYVSEYSYTEFIDEKDSMLHTVNIYDSLSNFLKHYSSTEAN